MSSDHRRRAVPPIVLAVVAAFLPLDAALAQSPGTDNRDGFFVNFEEPPIHPMELSSTGSELWVANIPDASVSIIDPTTLAFIRDVDVGLGPVAIRRRPGGETPEMWVACHSTGSVFVIDEALKIVRNTIALGIPDPVTGIAFGGEPCDIVFDATGEFAYVSLSILNQIVEIDCVKKSIERRIEFGSLFLPDFGGILPPGYEPEFIHAEEPRSLLLDGSTLYGLSFESGNGTFPFPVFDPAPERPIALETFPVDWWQFFDPDPAQLALHVPPPDRDLFSFDLNDSAPVGDIVLWRMGSFDFDVVLDPNPPGAEKQFFVSNVDFNNKEIGEHEFPVVGIARHRVSVSSPWTAGTVPPQSATHVDLNAASSHDPAYAATVKFGVPNEIALSSDGTRLYVACYETKTTAVLSVGVNAGQTVLKVIGALKSSGAGPRGVVLHESAGRVYVYNRADNTVDAFALPAGVGFEASAVQTGSIGVDVTPVLAKAGRKHHIDAANSSNGLQSCNTCHMDVHHDRIGWDLGEFSGNLALGEMITKDAKRTKVTMSLRGIEETAPFHWRGDRADLIDFNPAFQNLLGGSQLGLPQFAEFQAFVFGVPYPPNPRQHSSRGLTPDADAGKGFFITPTAHVVGFDTVSPPQPITCVGCHSLEGFSGTNNQVNNDFETPLPEDATQLRGLFDKESDIIDYNAADSSFNLAFEKFPATAWGFGNGGSVDTVRDFVGLDVFQQLDPEKDDIATFLSELDTGSAPATAWAWTLNARTAQTPPGQSPVELYLEPQAAASLRNCDAIVRGAVRVGGTWTPVGMRFDGSSTWISNRTLPPPGFPDATYSALQAIAAAGNGVFTFIGVPVGSGHRLGLDGDMDFLVDGDEAFFGASKEIADFDGDGAPDGYETAHGTSPADENSEPTESVAPVINPPLAPAWFNSNIAKLRWTTNEEATSRVVVQNVGGPMALDRTFEDVQFKKDHVLVVRGMNPGQTYSLSLEGNDPNGNPATPQVLTHTMNPHLFESVHVKSVTMLKGVSPGGAVTIRVAVFVVDQNGLPVPGATLTGKTVEWLPAGTSTVTPIPAHPPSNSQGRIMFGITPANGNGSGATVETIVISVVDGATNKIHFHPLEKQFSAKVTL